MKENNTYEIPRTCGECDFSEMKKYKAIPEQLICSLTERPAWYYIGPRRKECWLPEYLALKERDRLNEANRQNT